MNRQLIALLAAVALAGCATSTPTTGSAGSRSPLQPYVDDFRQTVVEGAVLGAIAGGLIGAVASGGDHRRLAQNVAAGAVAGGVLGAGVGYSVAGQKQEFARQEDALNALVNDGRSRVARLTRMIGATEQLIVQRQRELERVRALQMGSGQRLAAQKALVGDVEADQTALTKAVELAEASAKELQQNIDLYRQRFPVAGTRDLDVMRDQYEGEKRKLNQTPDKLNRLLTEVRTTKAA